MALRETVNSKRGSGGLLGYLAYESRWEISIEYGWGVSGL
jgi:hypothetical protein